MINTTADLKKYVSVSANFQFEEFLPYVEKAQRTFLKRYIGRMYFDLTTIDSDEKEEARELLNAAMANFGYYLFTPYNSVTMDASGMANVTSQNRSNISMGQLNDIRRDLLRTGHEAMDELLELLENKPDEFEDWHENFSTIYNELIVNNTSVFQRAYNIFNSRQTYLALQPSIRLVEDKLLKTTFCGELLSHLKTSDLNPKEKELKSLLSKAVVMATVAKVCNEGVYEITESGIRMKFDVLDYERNFAIEMTEQLRNKINNLNNNADQYLKMAVDYINENNTAFAHCNGAPIKTKKKNAYKPIITKSVIGL